LRQSHEVVDRDPFIDGVLSAGERAVGDGRFWARPQKLLPSSMNGFDRPEADFLLPIRKPAARHRQRAVLIEVKIVAD